MARLIDADALLEKMKGAPRYFDVKHDIEEMPTAYDVEKVVERLEELKISRSDDSVYGIGVLNGYAEAIEIVRRGGVE